MNDYFVMIREFKYTRGSGEPRTITHERSAWVNGLKEARELAPMPLKYSKNIDAWYGIYFNKKYSDTKTLSGIECIANKG